MSRMRRPAPCPRGHAALCPPTLAARLIARHRARAPYSAMMAWRRWSRC